MDGERVLIVSAHPLFREGIIRLLGDQVEVVGAVADLEEARVVIDQRQPQTIIVDYEGAELQETDLAPLLWPETEAVRVIYVTLAGNEMIVHDRRLVSDVTKNDLLHALQSDRWESHKEGPSGAPGGTQRDEPAKRLLGIPNGGNRMKKLAIPLLLTVIISIPLVGFFERVGLTPVVASRQAQSIDRLIHLLVYIACVIFALCMVFLLYSAVAFRRQPDDLGDAVPVEGSTPLEIAWTVVPLIIVIGVGVYSAGVLLDITSSPASPGPGPSDPETELEVKVTGFQWTWQFEYPKLGITSSELVLPVNGPVLFRVHATDVIHSFFVPEFRVKVDAIPGIENQIRITPTKVGEYKVRCAEMCGTGHAYMLATVKVVEGPKFQAWVAHETVEVEAKPQRGKQLTQQFGCLGCHPTDGSTLVGPTWKGLYQSTVTLQDGTTVEADDEYLLRSIVDPGAELVQGFADTMPKDFKDQLTEEQIHDIVEYIESLK